VPSKSSPIRSTPQALAFRASLFRWATFALAFGLVTATRGASGETTRHFDLAADSADKSLKAFAAQSGSGVVFASDAVKGIRTNAVSGNLTPDEAISALLRGTILVSTYDAKAATFAVRPATREEPKKKEPTDVATLREPAASSPRPHQASPETMKRTSVLSALAGWLVAAGTPIASGATASAPADETLRLTPFEVSADHDNSYGALNANSITGFRTELLKLPVSADVYNEAFMRDLGISSIEDMIQAFSPGAGFSFSDPSSSNNNPGDRVPDSYISLRGLAAPAQRMDGFLPLTGYNTTATTATGYSDNFNFERVEVINGPQALLYGFGGGGGVINMVSKQARFDRPASGSLRFELNQWGGKKTVLDYGVGGKNAAVRLALVDQDMRTRRVLIGGPMKGAHLQIAFKPFQNTVVRLTGMHSYINRPYGQSLTYTAVSAANDARSGQNVKYLLASGQLARSATGASGGGDIGSAVINWGNVDSFFGNLTNERTLSNIGTAIVETQVNSWLSAQLSLGAKDWQEDSAAQTGSLFPVGQASNPLKETALSASLVNDNYSPARTKTIRFALLAQNRLFGGRVPTNTIIGADFSRVRSAFISYRYYQADADWNPILDRAGNRIPQGRIVWPLGTTPQTYLPAQHTNRITVDGVRYVRLLANPSDGARVSAENPIGVTPGGEGHYIVKDINKGVFGANTTEWMHGKLQTLVGFRLAEFFKLTQNQGVAPTVLAPDIQASRINRGTSLDFNAGANYALREGLRPYFSVSSSYNPPAIQLTGPHGDLVQPAESRGEEVGIKFQDARERVSGSLAFYHVNAKNEFMLIQSTLTTAINPPGINGRQGAPSAMINVDRETKGVQLSMNASPTRNWRSRLSAGWTEGTVSSTKEYPLLYNDQFYTNGTGQVTYRDGSVVYVRPTFTAATPVATATTAGAIPLTVAMMNTPGGVYYANPRDVSGAILTTSNVGRVLSVIDPEHGPIRTGAVGLPISSIQINPGFTPPKSIEVSRAGELTTGYPTYTLAWTNMYSFSEGWLRGLRVGGTVRGGWDLRRFYYYVANAGPGEPRELFRYPTLIEVDSVLGYSRKFGRYTWSTQVNVSNMLNHYDVLITPNSATGFGGVKGAVFTQQPRSYLWTNTISF
jgi:outer membrane receptor protein involved in Fe transport